MDSQASLAGRDAPGGSEARHYPVIVIGAGPTGLTMANLLGRYGVSALVVERNATTVQEPRAVSIDDESLRTMQAAGVIETVLSQVVAGYGSRYLDPKGRCFLEVLPTQVIYGYPRRNAFRQPVFEAQLRDALEDHTGIDAAFGWTLDHFEQSAKAVTVSLSDPDGTVRTLTCDYLVGCDGASSSVRGALGLSLEGETFAEKWLIVDLENSPAPERDTVVFCDIDRPCIALPGPNDTRRFEFKLLPGETPDAVIEPAQVATLLADHGAAPQSIIRRKTVYTFHARLAPTWRVGRVFLAGDACHLTPPFAGQGMNSGIRDAHNLAWKLAAVVQGQIGPGLLSTYQGERRDHVGEMIKLALRMGRIMGPSSRLSGFVTQSLFRALRLWPAARDYFAQMKYKPKPRFAEGFLLGGTQDASRGLVGRLLPQPEVTDAEGRTVLLDTLLGDGFALVAVSDRPDRPEIGIDHPIWRRLAVRRVVLGRGKASSSPDLHLANAAPETITGATSDGDLLLLVRPDRYVAAAYALDKAWDMARAVEALVANVGAE